MMYCVQCGESLRGKFCGNCGTAVDSPALQADADPGDWSEEIRYDVLVQIPAVRERINREAAHSSSQMTGEEFLQIAEKAFSSLLGGVPISKVAAFAQPLYAKWGIGTGQSRTMMVSLPVGSALVEILCSLACSGQKIRCVQQATDGCIIEAVVPSDIWSFAADLMINVQRIPTGTSIEAAIKIQGQIFDWGKSRRCLDALFADITPRRAAG